MQPCLSQPSGALRCNASPLCRKPTLKFQQSLRRSHAYSNCKIRCSFKPETQRQGQDIPAPPLKNAPPPPPPPPPQPDAPEGPSRRTILAILLGGGVLSTAVKRSQEPQFYRDEAGIRYLKTKKGNPVAVTADGRGNVMMVDPAGNLYYDGGSPQLGIYMVTLKGELYNIYTDTQGEQQTRLLGNVSDLRSVRVKEIGGIPIEQLQAQYEIQRDRAGKMDFGMPDIIVGFPDDTPVPLPPDTVRVYEDGKDKIRLEGPPVLDEGAIYLEEKRNLWPFTQIEPGGGKLQRGIE